MLRFYIDGIFIRDSEGELGALMFNSPKKQKECLDWLNETIASIDDLKDQLELKEKKITVLKSDKKYLCDLISKLEGRT